MIETASSGSRVIAVVKQNPTDPLAGVIGAAGIVASLLGFFSWLGPVTIGRQFSPDEVGALLAALGTLAASIRTWVVMRRNGIER